MCGCHSIKSPNHTSMSRTPMNKKLIISSRALLALVIAVFGVWMIRGKKPIRHVVLISIDTCRADYLSSYGFSAPTTPNIDAIAKQSTRFENVITPVPITLPAHSSMLTGKIPPAHGVHNNIGYQLGSSNLTLAEILRFKGFRTGAIISSFVLDRQFGLSQGFNTYHDSFDGAHSGEHGEERKGDETTQLALEWLDKNKEAEKSFLFLHYYDPHTIYEPPEPYLSMFPNDPYAGEIAFTDDCIGRVINKLKEMDRLDSTLLVITGDHGEMLGEHGESEHSYFVYDAAIKVPLVIRRPGQKKSVVVQAPVGIVDIVPTVCAQLDIPLNETVQGIDLSPLLNGDVPEGYERYLYAESVTPRRIGASALTAISTGDWKFIQAPRRELYNLIEDKGEQRNLAGREVHRLRILEDKLKEVLEQTFREDMNNELELDAESIRKLESLGYVAGKAEVGYVFDEGQDDPKDFIRLFEDYLEAGRLSHRGQYNEADAILRRLLEQRPEFIELYKRLGDNAVALKKYEEAVLYYRDALKRDSAQQETQVMNNLAWIQATRPSITSRDMDEALKLAIKLCEGNAYKDAHTLDTLAVCYAASGDFANAERTANWALKMAKSKDDEAFAQRVSYRLMLFRKKLPYVEE